MHRIKGEGIHPGVDTEAKLSSVPLRKGDSVLDTCCGLGYTAIGAAKIVGEKGRVVTIEIDDASIEMAVYNPWSRELFDGSLPISVLRGDSCELLGTIEGKFDVIIHDPPARALTRTNLYSIEFYSRMKVKLKSGGHLFHYIGNPSSTESGRLYSGIMSRLAKAGFKNINIAEAAFGLVAQT